MSEMAQFIRLAIQYFPRRNLAEMRFLSFVFPIWLTIRVRRLTPVAVCIAFFVPVTLLLWFDPINVAFIG